MDNICNMKLSSNIRDKKTIIFFEKQGLDSFLAGIINALSDEYLTKKIIVTDFKQIDEK